jgi:hypothetical protein
VSHTRVLFVCSSSLLYRSKGILRFCRTSTLTISLSLTSRRIYSIFCIAYLPFPLDSVPVEEATRPRTVYAPVTLDSFRPPHLRIMSISPFHRPTMAVLRELSPVRKDTVVDANYGRARTLIKHSERVRQVYLQLNHSEPPICPVSILSIFRFLSLTIFRVLDR